MNLERPVALVTGADSGIGLEIARQLAQAGLIVLMGARDPDRGQKAANDLAADGLETAYVPLDVTDEASIAAAAEHISASRARLDILVNNAAIGAAADGLPGKVSLSTVRRIIKSHFIGHLGVTQAMLPLLRRSAAGRIINLSSPFGSMAIAQDPASPFYAFRLIGYDASRAALNMLRLQLVAELEGSAITVSAAVPGFAKSDLTGGQGAMTAADGAKLPVQYALSKDNLTGRFVGPGTSTPW